MNNFAETHIGQRQINEDNYLINQDLSLYVLADGVGGHSKGEVASNLACEVIATKINTGSSTSEAVLAAHQAILAAVKDDEDKQGMATTIVVVLFTDNNYEVAWVGDSRVYLWDNSLSLITLDDSYVELLLADGHINLQQLDTHPDKNVISQALGMARKDIIVHTNSGTLTNNQILLICSDGLYEIAKEIDMINTIKKSNNPTSITKNLVNTAVAKNGKDNITLISIKNDNLQDIKAVIKPTIYRKFDLKTGKIKAHKNQKQATNHYSNNTTSKDLISKKINSLKVLFSKFNKRRAK